MVSPSDPTPPPMPPRPGSGPETEINPQMENVLRNLNVNLEDELTRYRRQRHGRVPPPPPPRRAAQRQTIDLISVSANDTAAEKPQQPPTPPPPPPNPFLKHKASEPEESAELPDTELPSDAIEPDAPEMETPAESDSPALPIHSSEAPTEGYLESSEELLRSIEEEEEQPEPGSAPEPYSPERKSNSLLKLAGLVLVLLGGIGVGFAITNPAQFESLRSRVLPGTDVEPAETADSDLPEVPETPNQPATTADPSETASDYSPLGPDLSTREFQELDTIDDLVTLDVDGAGNATGTPSALPNPAQTPLPNPAQTPLPAPTDTPASPSAANSPTPATTSPAAAPPANSAPTNPATVTSPAPVATGSNFYVIASYTGDASLNKARELVPDAFVRDFDAGARIQLAAFDNQAQAEEQVAFLTEQGITVELFGPTNE